MKILVFDNYDSFTYNLCHYFQELQANLKVVRNDAITVAEVEALKPQAIVISPGPGAPHEAGISMDLIRRFHAEIPILGVCLGHQCIAEVFGSPVIKAKKIYHGKTSQIYHQDSALFHHIPSPFTAMRYHSLLIAKEELRAPLIATAWTQDEAGEPEEIMAIQHQQFPTFGVQFHPESILTEHGHSLLANFLKL